MGKLVVNALIAVIMMTTLVVGPYALQYGLGLRIGLVGLVMAWGRWSRWARASSPDGSSIVSAPAPFWPAVLFSSSRRRPSGNPSDRGRCCRLHPRASGADARLPDVSGGQQHRGACLARQVGERNGRRASQSVPQSGSDGRRFSHGDRLRDGNRWRGSSHDGTEHILAGMRLTFLLATALGGAALTISLLSRGVMLGRAG